MKSIIANTHNGRRLEITPDENRTLGQSLFLGGLWPNVPLCAGLGRCGLCKVRFISEAPAPISEETKRFSASELAHGWRLSCLHPATPCELDIPEPPRSHKLRKTTQKSTAPLSLAVDLGTTSVHWVAFNADGTAAKGEELNPQIGLGSEVMARLAFAATTNGTTLLRERILNLIREIIAFLPSPVERLAVSGNSAMTALLLGLPTNRLAAAPYALPDICGKEFDLAPDLPKAYIAPLFAPFVGADLSAGLVALHFSDPQPKPPFLLADLGTNGEFVLQLPGETMVTSVPMGPALEGVGLSFGRTAAPGVITAFSLKPDGPSPLFGAGEPESDPLGMTGTASLSLCALLLRNGLLEPSGQFANGYTPLAQKIAARFTTFRGEPAFEATKDVFLCASDVEEILKVKAAFNLALTALFAASGTSHTKLTALHLAGAIGEHVSLDDLERLGFLPTGLASRTLRAGNTSLAGTRLLLKNPQAQTWIESFDQPRVIDLASDPNFGTLYLERMVFKHVS